MLTCIKASSSWLLHQESKKYCSSSCGCPLSWEHTYFHPTTADSRGNHSRTWKATIFTLQISKDLMLAHAWNLSPGPLLTDYCPVMKPLPINLTKTSSYLELPHESPASHTQHHKFRPDSSGPRVLTLEIRLRSTQAANWKGTNNFVLMSN